MPQASNALFIDMYKIVTRLRNQIILLALMLIVAVLLGRFWSKPQDGNSGTVTTKAGVHIDTDTAGATATDVNNEYVIINVNPKGGEALSATGWRLVGVEHEATLGSATALPIQGAVNTEEPLVITKPTKLIVISGHSPIGVSFRENECTGLLATFQTFTPPLSSACVNCNEQTLDPISKKSYPDYNACVEEHKADPNFFSSAWRIYLGSETELWRKDFEIIKLVNRDGRILDSVSY